MNDTEQKAAEAGVPTTDQIESAMKANQAIKSCGTTMAFLSGQTQSMITALCQGNPRLALAVVSENKLFYEEVLRRSIDINHTKKDEQKVETNP